MAPTDHPLTTQALEQLRAHADPATLAGLARYGIPSDGALGVAVRHIKAVGAGLGRDHDLAEALWATGLYEARMLACFVGEPERLTAVGMDAWARDFADWSLCDTACFHLFDRTPLAWARVDAWADDAETYVRRAAFALLWGLGSHAKQASEEHFLARVPACERAADDPEEAVRTAVDMAMRSIARRGAKVRAAVRESAERLMADGSRRAATVGRRVAAKV